MAPLERFGVEFVLTFIVVLTYFVSVGTYKKWTASATFAVGASYTACTFVSVSVISFTRLYFVTMNDTLNLILNTFSFFVFYVNVVSDTLNFSFGIDHFFILPKFEFRLSKIQKKT